MRDRTLAVVGAACILAALATIWAARLTISAVAFYVSELGAQGMPTAPAFMAALLLIAAGGSLIAFAGRGIRSRIPVLRAWSPSVTLWVSCAFFVLCSQVRCTYGCPLPIGATFTWQDSIHTWSAVAAFALACWGMLQCAFALGHPALARLSLAAAVSVAVIAGLGGILSLLQWGTDVGSACEFAATTLGLLWICALGLSIALARSRPAASRVDRGAGEAASSPALAE